MASTRAFEQAWGNTQYLGGTLPDAVGRLKAALRGDLAVIGSLGLVQSLMAHDLLDEMRVMIDPIVIGSGKRLFGQSSKPKAFELAFCQPVGTGAILATYTRSRQETAAASG